METSKVTCPGKLSSYGKLFGTHGKNLEEYSGGFPPTVFSSSEAGEPAMEAIKDHNIAELSERSVLIELMLGYVHATPPSQLEGISFDVLMDLAEAAEKYSVYSAMESCKNAIERDMLKNPNEVLLYAINHGYYDLADKIAPWTIYWDLEDAQENLGPAFLPWVKYRESWYKLQLGMPVNIPYFSCGRCTNRTVWNDFCMKVLCNITEGHLLTLSKSVQRTIEETIVCQSCVRRAHEWKDKVVEEIEGLPPLTRHLRPN
ncbi:hypothetical protein AMATHDRAFT_87035 [Amanita thiersii Skay4041]|uniref:BTB domain-containing protein n=1 Tax=Amanita thiersii Skay4041 TaxID=703135 RepID=A0A2A9NLK7_9AGAR|nr:hypothetical protein AMATHDRAFT_87035 [Amanita thiersii Skay4041]